MNLCSVSLLYYSCTAASLAGLRELRILQALKQTAWHAIIDIPHDTSSGMCDNHVDINDNTLLVSPFFTANKNPLTAKTWV